MTMPSGTPSLLPGSGTGAPLRLLAGGRLDEALTPCGICSLRDVCLPCDLLHGDATLAGAGRIDDRRVRQGETLFQAGEAFQYLYTVRSGCFKMVRALDGGRTQVTGFPMSGDMLGADAIGTQLHGCRAVALEDSRVCAIPYARIEDLGDLAPELQHQLTKVMSSQILREQRVMMLLGVLSAEERVADFLLGLSQRLEARGYSPSEFRMRMTRAEMGSFLGLTVETVCRIMSRLRAEGLIGVQHRCIRILDRAGLEQCARQGNARITG